MLVNSQLIKVLSGLEIDPDGVLLVHSSFKGLSSSGFTPEYVLDELTSYMMNGTLGMPAMSWRICNLEHPFFDVLSTSSHVGALAEIFRVKYSSDRSLHPTHSMSVLGQDGSFLIKDHHKHIHPCSELSPWGRLAKLDADILLIDVTFERCTLMHYFEERYYPDLYLESQVEEYNCIDKYGKQIKVRTRRHRKNKRDFLKFQHLLALSGKIKLCNLNGVQFISFKAKDLAFIMKEYFAKNPFSTLFNSNYSV